MLQLKKIVFVLFLHSLVSTVYGECPQVKMSQEIQNQFQILYQTATMNLKTLSSEQSFKVGQVIDLNTEVLNKFTCYFNLAQDPHQLTTVMSVMKLQILQFRKALSKKDHTKAEASLWQLRAMMDAFLNKPSQLARRLGASVRSLYLDELEKLVSVDADLVERLMENSIWSVDISRGVELELMDQWQSLASQFSYTPFTPQSLARHFGQRAWKGKQNESPHFSKWVNRLKDQTEDTLEAQLLKLFKGNMDGKNSRSVNFDIRESESSLKHYLLVASEELRKNNYFSLKEWLAPVIDEKVKVLKAEMGAAWPLVSPVVGMSLEGNFKEITYPISLLSSVELAKAEKSYAKVKNPIGRLYEIVMLKTLTQVWTTVDIVQLRNDYDRVGSLKTLLAIQGYHKTHAEWPSSIQDLVQKNYLSELPKDHFLGKELKINSTQKQVWSVGQNGIDENGGGDDIGVRISQ